MLIYILINLIYLNKPINCKNVVVATIKKCNKAIMNTNNNELHKEESYVILSNEEYKKILPAAVYSVAREKGTERPGSSFYEHIKDSGVFNCAVCNAPLFKTNAKFESGSGWPSFYEPYSKDSIIYEEDQSHGMVRSEVKCSRCLSHLGHVFDDAPKTPTGLRYCINGVVLKFEKGNDNK